MFSELFEQNYTELQCIIKKWRKCQIYIKGHNIKCHTESEHMYTSCAYFSKMFCSLFTGFVVESLFTKYMLVSY